MLEDYIDSESTLLLYVECEYNSVHVGVYLPFNFTIPK